MINSNVGPISGRFRDMASFLLKTHISYPPLYLTPIRKCFFALNRLNYACLGMCNMADGVSLVLNDVLCFIRRKYGSVSVKQPKSCIMDFYDVRSIFTTKVRLLDNIELAKTTDNRIFSKTTLGHNTCVTVDGRRTMDRRQPYGVP